MKILDVLSGRPTKATWPKGIRHRHAQVMIWKSLAQRTTICSLCNDFILKDEERITFDIARRIPTRLPNGGYIPNDMAYVHHYCFMKALELGNSKEGQTTGVPEEVADDLAG